MDLLEKMATYVRVVEAGTFSAAATQRGLSGAAVSRQIATLEKELRTVLLKRTTRRMTLTEAGQRFFERSVRILRDVEEAQSVGRGDGVEGTLKVNASVSFGLASIVPHLPALMKKHPGLLIDLRVEDRLSDLVLDDVDVAIRVGIAPPDSATLVAHPLVSFERIIVASPSFLRKHGEPRHPRELTDFDCLTAMGDRWALVGPDGVTIQAALRVALRCNALHALRDLTLDGLGLTMLPTWFAHEAIAARKLKLVLPNWRSPPVQVNAIHRVDQRGSPRIRALLEHLRAALTQ